MYNVMYKDNGLVYLYCGKHVATVEEARRIAKRFTDKYVGKPYPNGKGWYPFTDVKVVKIEEIV